jgi:hypothetical protein
MRQSSLGSPSFALPASLLAWSVLLTGCPDGKGSATDAGAMTAVVDAGPPKQEKKLDAQRCDAGAADLEAIAKAAKKSCTSNTDCTEWIRKGNCGSVAVARPFPPAGSEERWKAAMDSVNVACPDEPKCRWASMGVECRGGQCQPSLEGALEQP